MESPFFKEVGQQADFQAVLEHDFVGANARTRRIDERRAKEVPGEAGKRPATRLATAILMYSFGGLRREGGGEADLLPPGVTEAELLNVCVGPDLDSTTAQACLKELKEQCLYLHYDGVRYCFKKDPNVTLLVEQEADAVARDEARVRNKIREMIEERMGGDRTAIVWPPKSGEFPDRDPSFLVAYMPFECGTKGGETREAEVIEYFGRYGNKPRDYRNGVGVAVPAEDQIEVLRRSVRYLLAIEQVRGKGKQLNLTDAQKDQLKEREATERTAAESALLKLYAEVWLPVVDGSGVGIEQVAAGGRPLVTTLDEKKRAAVHKRVMELLTDVQRKVFTSVQPSKIVELFKLGDGAQGLRTSEMVDGFYSFLGYPRLTSDAVIRRAIAQGVLKGLFGYTTGAPPLGSDGRFLIDRAKVAFERVLQEDEVDVQSGFLMAPAGIPAPASPSPGEPGPVPPGPKPGGQPGAPGPGGGTPVPPGPEKQHLVELVFRADRNQLFTAWNALANLADLAGKVDIIARATSEAGFDKTKLQNGVIEPLKETKIIE